MYESIVAEYLEFELPRRVNRDLGDLELPKPEAHNPVLSIIGVRRCGKTFTLYQLIDELRGSGVPRKRILYFDFDDDRLDLDSPTCASDVLDAYYKLVPEARDGCYLFLDEIQEVARWQSFVRRVSEHGKVTMVISGSSSKLLSTDIPTELRGRSLSHRIWPLSFAEYCHFHDVNVESHSGVFSKRVSDGLENAFEDYLSRGGFPAVQDMTPLARTQMLQAYAEQVVTRDVIERFGTVQYRVARRLARNALRSTGLSFSVNKQVKNMRSLGISVGTEKAYALLDDLEDAHLVFWVGDYNLSVRDNPRSVQKAYAVDPGLALAVAQASHLDVGQRLETVVFLELKRRYGMNREGVIASYHAEDVPEVDFVVGDASLEEQYLLVQVAEDIGDKRGDKMQRARYRREVGSLEAAMRRCGLARATIVTLEQEASIDTELGSIAVVPAWKWCLQEGLSQNAPSAPLNSK